jgi:hypothetical protein
MARITRRTSAPLVAILTVLTASACSSAKGEEVGEPPIKIVHVTSSAQIDLPVARYASSADDDKAIFSAVNAAKKQCASEFGVEATVPVTTQPSLMELDSVRRYGVINRAEVARYGYRPAPSAADADDDKAGGWNPSALEAEIMTGMTASGQPSQMQSPEGETLPEGGCSAEGFRTVWGGGTPPGGAPLVEDILAQAWAKTMADSRALAAADKWSACMKERGYDLTHRWDAGNSVQGASAAVQLKMAKLDLRCALDTNYVDVWYAVDVAYQQRLIDEHEGELQAALKQHAEQLDRAQAILEGNL